MTPTKWDRYEYHDAHGGAFAVSVRPSASAPDGAFVEVNYCGVLVPTYEAPKLALAVLENAGFTGDSNQSVHSPDGAVRCLRAYVTVALNAEAEVEAEAKALFEAYRSASGNDNVLPWEDQTYPCRDGWIAVARKVRESK
jgi:hypothetical protein